MFQLSKKEEEKSAKEEERLSAKNFLLSQRRATRAHTIKILKKVYFSTYSINSVF
tara:strand:+ start:3937 stop:4101 length:165 start_codon:yes stop_codon:yes gene_type:complete